MTNKKIYNVDEQIAEIELDDAQIEEMIIKLTELKKSKRHIHLSLDSKHELLIHHRDDELK